MQTGPNADGIAVGQIEIVAADGMQTSEPTGNVNLTRAKEAYLVLYGSGIRGAKGDVTATVDGRTTPVTYAGAAPGFLGLDQVNIRIPLGLGAGARPVPVALTSGGVASDVVYFWLSYLSR